MTQELIERLQALNWKAPVPDDIQSEVRMKFNEALAGGPNMNGDAGPTLTPNHALDCIWAAERIQSQSARIAELEGERAKLTALARSRLKVVNAVKDENERLRSSLTKDSTSG